MLHLAPESLPSSAPAPAPAPYAEAVTRLASIRHALRLVDPFGGGPASDFHGSDAEIAAVCPEVGEPKRRSFDRRTARTASGAAAALEALLAERAAGREPHEAASAALVDEIRRQLEDVSKLMLD